MIYEFTQLAFIVFCYYLPYILHFLYSESSKNKSKNKKIVYDQPVYIKKYNKKIRKQKANGTYIAPQKIVVENKFMNECKECLVSLGMKKIDAEKKVSNMFKNNNYNSIQQFIMDAYKS
jgi:hypothetical protein